MSVYVLGLTSDVCYTVRWRSSKRDLRMSLHQSRVASIYQLMLLGTRLSLEVKLWDILLSVMLMALA